MSNGYGKSCSRRKTAQPCRGPFSSTFHDSGIMLIRLAMTEVLPHPNHVITTPGSVRAEIRRTQKAVAHTQALKQEMLGHAHLEAASDLNAGSPGAFPSDRVGRPCIEGVRDVFAKQKCGGAEEQQPAQLGAGKGAHLHVSRKHVAREGVAGGVLATEISGIGRAQVGIGFVMRRSHVELAVAPDKVSRKEEVAPTNSRGRLLLRVCNSRDRQNKKYLQYKLHEGSVGLRERTRMPTRWLDRRQKNL